MKNSFAKKMKTSFTIDYTELFPDKKNIRIFISSGFRGAGAPTSGSRPPAADAKDIHFWLTDLKILRRLWRQSMLILRGERSPKKRDLYWSKYSKKCLKTPIFAIFNFRIIQIIEFSCNFVYQWNCMESV